MSHTGQAPPLPLSLSVLRGSLEALLLLIRVLPDPGIPFQASKIFRVCFENVNDKGAGYAMNLVSSAAKSNPTGWSGPDSQLGQ